VTIQVVPFATQTKRPEIDRIGKNLIHKKSGM